MNNLGTSRSEPLALVESDNVNDFAVIFNLKGPKTTTTTPSSVHSG